MLGVAWLETVVVDPGAFLNGCGTGAEAADPARGPKLAPSLSQVKRRAKVCLVINVQETALVISEAALEAVDLRMGILWNLSFPLAPSEVVAT